MSGSRYRHSPLNAPLRSWAGLAGSVGVDTTTRFVAFSDHPQWLREARAATEHSAVRLVGDTWSGPCSVQAGGVLVEEPCCAGESFDAARWEIRDRGDWAGWRCGGCGLEVNPDVWLDVEIDMDTAAHDERGQFTGCELPDPKAFAAVAERAHHTALGEHRRRARDAGAELLDKFVSALHGDTAVRMSREALSVQLSEVRPEGARELEPILAVGHEPGLVRTGWWDLCDLAETPQWREAAVIVAAEPVRAAARLAEMLLDPDDIHAAAAGDRSDAAAALEAAWDRRMDDFVPAWLTDPDVMWELRVTRSLARPRAAAPPSRADAVAF